ncbi:MAG: c-type cytochrome [Halomonas sp.]|jgi:sulfide dehydrogenase cytochrome subunit|uniref:C-type cytochrome n=1 Tax=Billgrantia tianxiuensis TaxID=2497861 RepID=A0A6I6SPH2_9GAMM|nr:MULTISPECIES: c-type cytochrome [Halomonas]MCE8034014.1 c-type cytochrome [Halomonas sp. MCCC 1A11057]MDX5434402.1 c-type cytochrome [Halomonas sp.]QHC51121.1 c-type cytochrome [Halomonas tianxiuensis]
MKRFIRLAGMPLFGLLLFTGVASPGLAEEPFSSEQVNLMASACANCHGTDGRLVGSVPTLAGRPAAVLEARLLAFKHNETTDATIMDRIAKGFTDEELAALAGHFAAIDPDEDDAPESEQEPQQ